MLFGRQHLHWKEENEKKVEKMNIAEWKEKTDSICRIMIKAIIGGMLGIVMSLVILCMIAIII